MMSQPLDKVVNDWASIKKPAFKAVVGVSFGLSILSVFARVWIRFKTRRKMYLDDYLLFFAALCLVAATGLIYRLCDELYLATAIQKDITIVMQLNLDRLNDIIENAVQENASFLIIAWTTTFFVKFSFLAFFKQLIHKVASIQYYYWTVVGITVVSWLFLISEPFILCPYFGTASLACFDHSKDILYVSMTGLVTGLDALSDILIASIPIIVLHRAKIQTTKKITLGVFLCLNLFMVGLAITRASRMKGAAGVDVPWEFFWQFMEASVAVLMGSLTVFRTLLTSKTGGPDEQRGAAGAPWPQMRPAYVFRRQSRKKRRAVDIESQDGLPDVPSATMTGVRTFIQGNNCGTSNDGGAALTGTSQQDTLDDDHDDGHQLKTHSLLKSDDSHGSSTYVNSQLSRE